MAKTNDVPVNQAHFLRRMPFWRGTTPLVAMVAIELHGVAPSRKSNVPKNG
jgi:hypothetical protein